MLAKFKDEYNLKAIQKIKINSVPMYITPRYRGHYLDNRYEDFSTQLLVNYLKPKSTFVEIGAHYGYFSLVTHHQVKDIENVAIEPVEVSFKILQKNFALNKIEQATLINAAASDKNGTVTFNLTEASDSAGIYDHPLTKTIKKITVKTIKADDLLNRKPVGVITIDVEGHEIPVLNGLTKTIKKNHPYLLVEYNPELQKRAGYPTTRLGEVLKEYDYDLYAIDDYKKRLYRLQDNVYSLDDLREGRDYINLWCIPRAKSLAITMFTPSAGKTPDTQVLIKAGRQLQQGGASVHLMLPQPSRDASKLISIAISTDMIRFKGLKNQKDFNQSLGDLYIFMPELIKLNPQVIVTESDFTSWGPLVAGLLKIPTIEPPEKLRRMDRWIQQIYTLKATKRAKEQQTMISGLNNLMTIRLADDQLSRSKLELTSKLNFLYKYVKELQATLDQIQKSKYYRLWRRYIQLKEKIIK